MRRMPYGTTGLSVSILGLGAGQVGGASVTDAQADSLLNGVLDAGITLIDTARGYGQSEARIGRYISHRRSEFILSTKIGYGVDGHEDWTYSCIRAGIERALTLMRTDELDIVHLHSCRADVLRDSGVVDALLEARDAGLIRAAAYSGENADLAHALQSGVFDGYMASVNICDQRVIDDALPAMHAQKVGFIAKRPIANAPWVHAQRPAGQYVEPYWDRFRAMGFQNDRPPGDAGWADIALRFAAYTPGVSCSIVGTASLDHLRANIAAVNRGPLDPDAIALFREAFHRCDTDWTGQV